ncbi:hypothetical protein C2G38_2182332 [Gigaspora rosea]|uniref:DUF6570 domain-containing protein n=1 Tax=Gigaspora rosea TaxID=44941 RepID=A0A397VJB6_9GLOM|nr:hypothetical protein C2G38_2182332 [Gigaspora rosea]
MPEVKNTLRQCRNRDKESPEKHRERLSNNQNRKLKNKAAETAEEREVKLARTDQTEQNILGTLTTTFRTILPQETERPRNGQSEDDVVSVSQAGDNAMNTNVEPLLATTIILIRGMCRRCSTEKTLPKKFSAENNMDPGEIPNELQGLTEVEKMLIAQANNHYYANIVIDNKVFESLPQEGYIDNQLSQIQTSQAIHKANNESENDNNNDNIMRSFVPFLPPTSREDVAINNALDRIDFISNWMGCLHVKRAKKIKLAKYFKHLLQYNDSRFVYHTRWRYFALNIQMRWKALQEERAYVRQKLNDTQLTVSDIRNMIDEGDTHIADRIMQFEEGLRGT